MVFVAPFVFFYQNMMFYFLMLISDDFILSLRLVACQERALFRKHDLGFAYGNFIQDFNQYLAVEKVRSFFTEDEHECPFNCVSETQCYSFNIAVNPDSRGLFLCELLITDKYRAAKELRPNATFHHWSPWSYCMTRPCLNGASCIPDYQRNGYQCKCSSGYSETNCENEKWEKLNSVPLCYGARDDSYGKFTISEAGYIIKLTLTHINGSLSCAESVPPSYWGCDSSGLVNGKLTTLVTFQNKTRLLPAKINNDSCTPSYSINGVSLNSTKLSFDPFGIPLAVEVNDSFQIWSSQDFTDCFEENNAGEICVDVHALYT